jgi:hypothetical protein
MKPAHLSSLYRVIVSPCDLRKPLRMAFVRAGSAAEAQMTVAAVVAALDHCRFGAVEVRAYGVVSAHDLIALGANADPEVRLFEIGAQGKRLVEHPLFLLDEPAGLTRKWAWILQGVKSDD